MSTLKELLKKHCPDGVEYKNLDEVVSILDNLRKPVSKDKRTKGNYPYYGANGIQDYVDNYLFDGTFILMGEDGSVINKNNSPVLNWASGKIWVNNHAHVLFNEDINILRFVFYYLQTIDVSSIVRGTPPKINQQNLRNIVVPFPPIEVQEEIVRILDEFTEKTTKLQDLLHRETVLRKKQYEYYRDKLLTFSDEVEYKFLGEVCNVQSGGTPLKTKVEYWENGNIKWLGSGVCENQKTVNEITNYISELGLEKSSAKLMKKDTTLIALVGATIGKVAFLPFEAAINQNIAGVYPIDTNKLNPSFVYYICTTYYKDFISFGNGKLTMANLSFVRNLKIPVPPLEEQERIVKILDQFDTLCNDITKGLPAEIEMRKKQYEYYRDKLLTFKEKKKS